MKVWLAILGILGSSVAMAQDAAVLDGEKVRFETVLSGFSIVPWC